MGQVAVQKPQWTHLRMIALDSAIFGSESWGGGEVGLHGFRQNGTCGGIENPGRIECLLYPLGQLGQGSGSGSKTNTDARRLSGPRIKVAWPVAGGMAPRTTCAEPCSESGTDTGNPPAQS